MPRITKDITGEKIGRLTVLERVDKDGKHSKWLCRCDCGKTVVVYGSNLTSQHTKSCGCYNLEQLSKRPKKKSPPGHKRLYNIWQGMRQRCTNPHNSRYNIYGGKGIAVYEGWDEFGKFKEWALANGYKEELTIDRIDSDKNYEPSNCQWITLSENSKKTKQNIYLTYNGKTQSRADWAKECNINLSTLRERLNNLGWSVEKALTTPAVIGNNGKSQ